VIPWPLGNGPPFCNAAWFIQAAKHLREGRKAQGRKAYEKLTSLNNYLLVFYLQSFRLILRQQKRTISMQQKFEQAFDVMKELYMFMHEDREALYFKHIVTREYIKIQK
jgi:hypothetical protein